MRRTMRRSLLGFLLVFGLWSGAAVPAAAAEQTTLQVVVKDAKTGDPVYQAHLTLAFRERRRFGRSKAFSYTGKTDKQGRCAFPAVNKGEVTLMVTAPQHESFGKTFDVEKDNQLIEIKLRQPQPVL